MDASTPLSRLGARLLAISLPKDMLLAELAKIIEETPAAKSRVDALIARYDPPSPELVQRTLLSADLLTCFFATLHLSDGAAASVCKTWCQAWKDTDETRRGLRLAEPLPQRDVDRVVNMTASPSGEWMCIENPVNGFGAEEAFAIVDCSMRRLRGVVLNEQVISWCVGEDRLYVSHADPSRIMSIDLDSCATDATYVDEHREEGFCRMALGPNGLLYAVRAAEDPDTDQTIAAFDALTLERRFSFGDGRAGYINHRAPLTVAGEEVYVGYKLHDHAFESHSCFHVFSLSGDHLRTILGDWRQPRQLLHVDDRLYLTEYPELCADEMEEEEWSDDEKAAGRRLFVLTPQGETLQVWKPEGDWKVDKIAALGRKLIVKVRSPDQYQESKLIALKGV